MGDEPTALAFTRSLAKDGIDIPANVAKALLNYIDSLTRKITILEEDKDNDYRN